MALKDLCHTLVTRPTSSLKGVLGPPKGGKSEGTSPNREVGEICLFWPDTIHGIHGICFVLPGDVGDVLYFWAEKPQKSKVKMPITTGVFGTYI